MEGGQAEGMSTYEKFKEWECGCNLQYNLNGTGWTKEDPYYEACKKHVLCDKYCMALNEPVTFEEYKAAYEHWHHHGYLSGCSHGS
jgi:hypothetical protein